MFQMITMATIKYLFVLLLYIRAGTSLIGYDCGGQRLNVTTFSLIDTGECNINIPTTNNTDTYIQLLQVSEYNMAHYIQCKIEVIRHIYYCGMHSHISAIHGGYASYLEDVNEERCNTMHTTGMTQVGIKEYMRGLHDNFTNIMQATISGKINIDGTCEGAPYHDRFGDWSNVVVQALIKVSMRSGYAAVHLNSGKIILRSGTRCDLSDGMCVDPDEGFTFWKSIPLSTCGFQQYDVLYEGTAVKIQNPEPNSPTIYSINTQDITFSLMTTKEILHCGYTLKKTEHPKLIIVETRRGNEVKQKSDIPIDNLDIFAYVNSKFVYVERHVRNQMTTLYQDIMRQRCDLEREVLKNILSFATLIPDEFAYRIMKNPGYMAIVAGEAVHIVQCIPVEVMVRKPKECYTELPVMVRNTSLFLTPRSRILTKFGTQRECSFQFPTMYHIIDTWVQLTPDIHPSPTHPQQLQPSSKLTWKYVTPTSLATTGIYTQEDINKLRDHIMFPAEKPAVLNFIARGLTGYTASSHPGSLYNMLDEESLNKIAQNTASKLWGGFITFGSATAGVIGIFIVIRVIKIIIDTAIHGYALHTVYGCSLHLLGALWSSLAHLLLHLAHRSPPPKPNNDDDAEQPASGPGNSHHDVITSAPLMPSKPCVKPTHSSEYVELSARLASMEQTPNISVGALS